MRVKLLSWTIHNWGNRTLSEVRSDRASVFCVMIISKITTIDRSRYTVEFDSGYERVYLGRQLLVVGTNHCSNLLLSKGVDVCLGDETLAYEQSCDELEHLMFTVYTAFIERKGEIELKLCRTQPDNSVSS